MLQPYYHRGEIVAYGWCFIHFSDMGGRVPSSISPSNHEIFQEGLRVPPMKLVRRDVNIFEEPTRTELVRAYQRALPEQVERPQRQQSQRGE